MPPDNEPIDSPAAATAPLDPRRRRLLFRAHHRGTKEADLMIGAFAARNMLRFTEAELDDLEAVLELPDVDLTEWLTGRQPIPEDARTPMLDRMAVECAGLGAGLPPDVYTPPGGA